jgi:hypothetical protein
MKKRENPFPWLHIPQGIIFYNDQHELDKNIKLMSVNRNFEERESIVKETFL